MKKFLATILAGTMSAICCFAALAGCSNTPKDPEGTPPEEQGPQEPGPSEQTPSEPTPSGGLITAQDQLDALLGLYPDGDLLDAENGFASAEDVEGARVFRNGDYLAAFDGVGSRQDIKFELVGGRATRMANLSAGFAFTLPATEYTADYSIAKYRTQYHFGGSTLSVSLETKNPYGDPNGWYTYVSEWLFPYFKAEVFASSGIEMLTEPSFEFTQSEPHGDLDTFPGYDYYRYDLRVEDESGNIGQPYYHIAALRKAEDKREFIFFHLKSDKEAGETLDAIVKSYRRITPKGIQRNYFDAGEPVRNPRWNEATSKFYEKFVGEDYLNWGAFSASMPGYRDEWKPESEHYRYMLDLSKRYQTALETAWGAPFDIYPTYTALSYAGEKVRFPVYMAKELAGGDGYNGKPVLQFTYQYTVNNNTMGSTPLFDILRGKYDEQFHELARDVKGYTMPVLFRLNNEMNTDWTSYSGIMNLLDPDLFRLTWIRLYEIFEEEGVDNAIWIWNPIADSAPYSGWGEDLCYFPGVRYVQLLGETAYEFNNYDAAAAPSSCKTFNKMYGDLYQKNKAAFSKWAVIISEFACGSGGETSGALGRNRDVQLGWVKDMFAALNADTPADYVKQIKGAVWFNANDYDGEAVSNRLQLVDPDSHAYDDLAPLHEIFREGLSARKRPS